MSKLLTRNAADALVAHATKHSKDHREMSLLAVDLVFKNFPRKHKEREFIAMIVMAHRYNEKLGKAFPKRKTFAGDVGCSDRHAKRLLRSLRSESDIFPIEQGGKGPGSVTCYGLNPKYLPDIKGDTCKTPLHSKKGGHSSVRKGGHSLVQKGGHAPKVKCPHNINKQKESAAAASALAGPPPPPLLSEPELDHGAIAKFQADFERSRGRKLLGAT
jgi:hypothetical protein